MPSCELLRAASIGDPAVRLLQIKQGTVYSALFLTYSVRVFESVPSEISTSKAWMCGCGMQPGGVLAR
jgi:hypothetical protein